MTNVQSRMKNAVMIIPEAMKALHALKASAEKGGVPSRTLLLVELRASQINGCSVCVDMHARGAQAGRRNGPASLRHRGLARCALVHR